MLYNNSKKNFDENQVEKYLNLGGDFVVTIKEIADLCGVSRGTVDRVLNNRGNVKSEKKALILKVAKEMKYTPNPAGKALAARKLKPTVAVVMPSIGISFFDVVLEAMQKSASAYAMYGMQVQWYLSKGYNAQVQYNQLMKLKDKVNAVILMPINDECICQAIKALTDNGVFVVTINTDIENSTRNCYVGTDYFNGGCTAGALLQLLHRRQLNVGITLGSLQILGHQQRLEGFRHLLQSNAQAKILGIVEDQDDEILSYEKNLALLREHPEINALFAATSGGIYGACRAIMACQPAHDMTVVVFDNLPTTVELMEQGIIQATIYQHPRRQGQIAMQIVFDYLVNGKAPEKELYLLTNEIRIKENISATTENQ